MPSKAGRTSLIFPGTLDSNGISLPQVFIEELNDIAPPPAWIPTGFQDSGVTELITSFDYDIIKTDNNTIILLSLIVQFGSDNESSHTIEFDIRRGAKYAFPMNVGNVQVRYQKFPLGLQPPIRLTVSCGRWSSGGQSGISCKMTKTVPGTDQNNNPIISQIPKMAVSALLISASGTSGTLNQFTNSSGGTSVSIASIGQSEGQAVPIAPGAEFFNLTNAHANDRVLFNLA